MQDTIHLTGDLYLHWKDFSGINKGDSKYKADMAHIWISEIHKPQPERKIDLMIRITHHGKIIVEDLKK